MGPAVPCPVNYGPMTCLAPKQPQCIWIRLPPNTHTHNQSLHWGRLPFVSELHPVTLPDRMWLSMASWFLLWSGRIKTQPTSLFFACRGNWVIPYSKLLGSVAAFGLLLLIIIILIVQSNQSFVLAQQPVSQADEEFGAFRCLEQSRAFLSFLSWCPPDEEAPAGIYTHWARRFHRGSCPNENNCLGLDCCGW